ncbi:protein draper-like isoform X1 [Ostrea edulis]|uniref:protein draper-like isoform X1 n=1 Tax=Ostrea edulis TaxID=37623 RepID=UPI0024AE8D6D|nr:protein draper-like isoform X1 [Ostrea edulis]
MDRKLGYIRASLLLATCFLLHCSDVPKCETGFKNCCPDYKWNVESQRCEKCLPGYLGINCSIMCPYPYYGEGCQEECDCERDLCNVSVGCKDVTTEDSDEEATPCTTETQPVAIHRTTHSSVDRTTKKLNPETRNSESLNINDVLLVLILVFGSVDFILCCTYLAVGFYERRHTAAAHVHEISDTTGDYRGNDTSYENVEINLPSTSGVGVRVSSSAMPILERACDI